MKCEKDLPQGPILVDPMGIHSEIGQKSAGRPSIKCQRNPARSVLGCPQKCYKPEKTLRQAYLEFRENSELCSLILLKDHFRKLGAMRDVAISRLLST
jgi:hypothetical protein